MDKKQMTKRSQELLMDITKLVERMHNGQRLMDSAVKDHAIAEVTKLVETYQRLGWRLISATEELVLLHQHELTGIKGHILRNGKYVPFEQAVTVPDTIDFSVKDLRIIRDIKIAFGEDITLNLIDDIENPFD